MRPMDHMSDRNGTPGFYENTLRHFTALSTRSFGTKMETVGTKTRGTVAKQYSE